jgi:hypothetical protein
MNIEVFKPKFFLKEHYGASWCSNIKGQLNDNIPVEIAQGNPRLKFVQDKSSEDKDWCAGAIPFRPDWSAIDISAFKSIDFDFYCDSPSYCKIGLISEGEDHSSEYDLNSKLKIEQEELTSISIPISFFKDGFDVKNSRLLKIIGYANCAFYISDIVITNEVDS